MSEPDLGSQLLALADDIEPTRIDLTERVLDTLNTPRVRAHPVLAAVAAALLVLIAVIGLIAPAREAVASWFGIGNTRVAVVGQLADPSPSVPPTSAGPADRMPAFSLDEQLAGPIVAIEERSVAGTIETIVRYRGLTLTASPVESRFRAVKSVLRPEAVEAAIVTDGEPALWIEGRHTRTIGDFTEIVDENVLIWVRDGQEYRLSGDLNREDAIALAQSMG